MAVTLQFVDRISTSPTVRLDLNNTAWTVQKDGTTFGFPDLNRATVSTLLQDGGRVPASAYGFRTLQIKLLVNTADPNANATATQSLFRELNRPTNILKFAPNTTNPVFFQTIRSVPDSLEPITDGSKTFIVVSILAQPFALGQKVVLGPYTVNQDPASGSNPCYVDIPAASVTGDVETPALVRFTANGTAETMVFATRRRGTPSSGSFLMQSESMTLGGDTTLVAGGATYSGAGNNLIRTSFATNPDLGSRGVLDFPTTATNPVDLRGTYRVFMRCATPTLNQVNAYKVQLRWGPQLANPTGTLQGEIVSFPLPAQNTFKLIDLGLISFPVGNDPVHSGYSGTELKVDNTMMHYYAQRTAGTGSLDSDYFLFVPADQEFCSVKWPDDVVKPVLDGPNDTVYSYTLDGSDDVVKSGDVATRTGSLPVLSPNQTNRLFALRKVETGNVLTDTAVFEVHFWPKFLYVSP